MFMVPCITNLHCKCPTRCNNRQSIFYFSARSLYMFRVPFTPIIRIHETVVTATGMSYISVSWEA